MRGSGVPVAQRDRPGRSIGRCGRLPRDGRAGSRAACRAAGREGVSFAATAARAGYADQAHLAREVRAVAGVPLGRLVADLRLADEERPANADGGVSLPLASVA